MRASTLDEDERSVISVLYAGSREETVQALRNALAWIGDDAPMQELLVRTGEKLARMSGEDFDKLDLDIPGEEDEDGEGEAWG